jgi:hypothetical protein
MEAGGLGLQRFQGLPYNFFAFLGTSVLFIRTSCPLYPLSTYLYLYESMYGILNYQYRYVWVKKKVSKKKEVPLKKLPPETIMAVQPLL